MRLSPLARRRLLLSASAGLVVLVLAFLAAPRLASFARGPSSGETTLEKLDVYGTAPRFSLTERSGRAVSREDLAGKVWVANFIYTKCKETCPTQSLQVARLQAEFAGAPDLQLVSITVDPKNDTREVLTEYAGRYGADRERWLFLTGDKREIYCLAKGLNLSVVDPSDPNPPACGTPVARAVGAVLALSRPPFAFATHGSEGLVMHSARLVLVDRAARVRAYHLATDDDSLKRLRPNLRALLIMGALVQWPTILTLIMAPVLVVAYVRLAWREERELEAQFGEAYRAYRRRVPGFVPALGLPGMESEPDARTARERRRHA